MGKVFVPHELKTIEVDTEKKIFRINGEDFGENCTHFSIDCDSDGFRVSARIDTTLEFANYDIKGELLKRERYERSKQK
nr:MAG TPA: hypothetical protein [Caudoviricetes sp.]